MRKLFLILISFFAISCQNKTDHKGDNQKENINIKDDSAYDTISRYSEPKMITTSKPIVFTKEFLEMDDVRVNNQPLLVSIKTFYERYPKTDSEKTDIWECGNPLEWLDENWMTETYGKKTEFNGTFENYDSKITSMYVNGTTFISNKHVVLFDKGYAKQNTLTVKSANIKLDHSTTIDEFQKLFPNQKKHQTSVKNGFAFSIPIDNNKEDAFEFYFENGKLISFELSWLLC